MLLLFQEIKENLVSWYDLKAAVALVRDEAFSDFSDTLVSLIYLIYRFQDFVHEHLPLKNKFEEIIDLLPQIKERGSFWWTSYKTNLQKKVIFIYYV